MDDKKNRRDFIKESIFISSTFFLGCKQERQDLKQFLINSKANEKSKVIVITNHSLRNNDGRFLSDKVLTMLDTALNILTNSDNPREAWLKIVTPKDRVSLKLNCLAGKGMSTNKELVEAVIYRLLESGIKKENIIVWERLNDDLERAGYSIITDNNKVRYLGNDYIGYTDDFYFFGEVGSLLSRVITDFSDVIINLPVLKDHGIVGLSVGMKNMFGAIHNPNKYHMNTGDPYVADVNALPVIKNKLRLTICDAFDVQYEGGPSFKPQFTSEYNSFLVSTDPVALDYVAWKIIEKRRKENNIVSLKEALREPKYIFTASDDIHKLGFSSDEKIELVYC